MNVLARPGHFGGGMDYSRRTHYVATQQVFPESSMAIVPRRSVLYMPASNARALEKSRSLPADGLIFDLEDAVAPDAKNAARDHLEAFLKSAGLGSRERVIRINGLETPWSRDDFSMAARCAPDAILVPKISSPGDIMRAARDMRDAGVPEKTRLWAMMETPLAVLNADSIARTVADPSSRLSVLVMGVNDLARETRARLSNGRAAMMPWIATCVAAARAHGADILDGVCNETQNPEILRAECEQGRDFGMDGKTLIHPSQIDICNEVFSPAADEISWARRVVAEFAKPENAMKGVLQLDGRMLEHMHLDMARRVIEIDRALRRESP